MYAELGALLLGFTFGVATGLNETRGATTATLGLLAGFVGAAALFEPSGGAAVTGSVEFAGILISWLMVGFLVGIFSGMFTRRRFPREFELSEDLVDRLAPPPASPTRGDGETPQTAEKERDEEGGAEEEEETTVVDLSQSGSYKIKEVPGVGLAGVQSEPADTGNHTSNTRPDFSLETYRNRSSIDDLLSGLGVGEEKELLGRDRLGRYPIPSVVQIDEYNIYNQNPAEDDEQPE